MKTKNVLITGGAGYIGSYTAKELLLHGYQPIIVDNLSSGVRAAVPDLPFYEGNFGCKRLLDKIFTDHSLSAVIHLAASIHIKESLSTPELYYQNNVVHMLALLEAMVRHSVSPLIFSSSAAVYGVPEQEMIDESHPLRPITPYGSTKLIGEMLTRDFAKAHGIRYTTLRYFNAAGADPEKKIPYNASPLHLIPRILNALEKKAPPLTIYGTDYPTPDGTCIRDYIHIHDLATAHRLAMEALFNEASSSTYNLGSGTSFSIKEVIHAVETVTNRRVPLKTGTRREGDPPYLLADPTKAKEELNWSPLYPKLETMIAHAWESMIQSVTYE